jgi:transcription initiation factor TFIIB
LRSLGARGESLALRDSAALGNTAITYSPLFVRSFARNHKLRITSKGIKRRASERFQESTNNKPKLSPRKPLSAMAQVLSPGQVIEPAKPKKEDDEWRENLNVRMICQECREDPPNLYEDHASGDMVCTSCGLVLAQRNVDVSSEWRTFSNDDQGNDDPSRVGDGPNALLNGAQLNTGIAFGDGMRSKDLHRAQNKSNVDKGNKPLLVAYKQIGALCDGWQLPNAVSDTTKHLYKDASEAGLAKGKSQDALIAGCLFFACRRNNVPRTFREVMELTRVSKKEIGRTFKALEKFIRERDEERLKGGDGTAMVAGGMSPETLTLDEVRTILNLCSLGTVVSQEVYNPSAHRQDPSDLCNRFCSMLDMDQKTTNVAIQLAAKLKDSGSLAGRSPLSAAAASIFMAGHLMGVPKSAKEIATVVGVSDSTIRGAYKLLYGEKDILIDAEIQARGVNMEKLPKPA